MFILIKADESLLPFCRTLAVTLLLLSAGLFGCDRSLEPFEKDVASYSIYGALSVEDAPDYIRVRDVRQPFIEDSTERFEADVTFENLNNNEVHTLNDTIVNFGGFNTFNLIVDQQLEYNNEYQLTVEGDDGTYAQSTVSTPGVAVPGQSPNRPNCYDRVQLRFENVVKPEQVHVEMGFPFNGEIHWAHVGGTFAEFHHIEEEDVWYLESTMRNLLKYAFPPIGDGPPCSQPPGVWCWNLDSSEIQVRYYHLGSDWESEYRVEEFRSPTEAPEIDGGIGFLGAYSKGYYTVEIDTIRP